MELLKWQITMSKLRRKIKFELGNWPENIKSVYGNMLHGKKEKIVDEVQFIGKLNTQCLVTVTFQN